MKLNKTVLSYHAVLVRELMDMRFDNRTSIKFWKWFDMSFEDIKTLTQLNFDSFLILDIIS